MQDNILHISTRFRNFYYTSASLLLLIAILPLLNGVVSMTTKNNGDIYIVSDKKFLADRENHTCENITLNPKEFVADENVLIFDDILNECNESFSIPMEYLVIFNTSAELPNLNDKTGMCFLRCFYEKSGFITNWKLNADLIRKYFWPATGDSIEICENEGANETDPCIHLYAIAKCLMIRAIVDAKYV